jgi:hypothetical protein
MIAEDRSNFKLRLLTVTVPVKHLHWYDVIIIIILFLLFTCFTDAYSPEATGNVAAKNEQNGDLLLQCNQR